MSIQEFETLSSKALVLAYNEMAISIKGVALGFPRNRPVNKFSSKEVGIKRCRSLESSIMAKTPPRPTIDKRKVARSGSNRQKAIDCLVAAEGGMVSQEALIKSIYGEFDPKFRGKMAMVLKGLVAIDIGTRGLPYELVKEKNKKEVYFALRKN